MNRSSNCQNLQELFRAAGKPVTSNSFRKSDCRLDSKAGANMVGAKTGSKKIDVSNRRGLRLCDVPPPESLSPDYLLGRAVADGDISALGELYVKHHRQVYAVCLNM